MSNVKTGVTLYSFTTEYCKGIMTLEDCIKTAKDLGAAGFEIVATQMIPSYPYVDDQFLGEFRRICKDYEMEPVCYGANMDRGLRGDRNLTDDEMLAMAVNDIKNAYKMGCKCVREQYLIGAENFGRLAPYAEAYGVKVGIEIHNPDTPITPMTESFLEVIEKTGSKYLGLVPDFGCFATKPNKMGWDNALKAGAKLELLELARDMKYDEVPLAEAKEKLIAAGATDVELSTQQDMYAFLQFKKDISKELEGLKKIIPYCIHMHGKYHYVYENLEESAIPYDRILEVVRESDYEGYIVSEYEEYNSNHSFEMLRRHQLMMKKYLGQEA
ncbi:MAG: sugar phosphate isomerase/epimerase [Parasporobacterium sp.]|nr:sugar phosphate isomerase/epimerase [Parasporobacterium sp.]